MAKRAIYRVVVDDQDITSRLHPLLVSLSVSDKEGRGSDTADLTLDDTGGATILPKTGARISIAFGWESDGAPPVRFVGTVDEVNSEGSRGGGTVLTVSAKGIDTTGGQKAERSRHWDDATLETVLRESGQAAGISSIKVDPELGQVRRPYWFQANESFLAFAQRLAEELGGTFKVQGSAAIVAKRGADKSPSGQVLPTIVARRGENLHAWSISPAVSRPRFKAVKARVYDRAEARWKDVEASVADEETEATRTLRAAFGSVEEAEQRADAEKRSIERARGGGTVTIEGNGNASPEARCLLAGTRPGVDGSYRIVDVLHDISRGSGWTTTLSLTEPTGDAGKDGRKAPPGAPAAVPVPTPAPRDDRFLPAP